MPQPTDAQADQITNALSHQTSVNIFLLASAALFLAGNGS